MGSSETGSSLTCQTTSGVGPVIGIGYFVMSSSPVRLGQKDAYKTICNMCKDESYFSRRCIQHSPQVYVYLRQCHHSLVDSDFFCNPESGTGCRIVGIALKSICTVVESIYCMAPIILMVTHVFNTVLAFVVEWQTHWFFCLFHLAVSLPKPLGPTMGIWLVAHVPFFVPSCPFCPFFPLGL